MIRSRILHRTYYNFSDAVELGPHILRLRPREGHDLRIVSSTLSVVPEAALRWYRDAEDNSVGIATFGVQRTRHLALVSDVVVEQYGSTGALEDGTPGASAASWTHDPRVEAAVLWPYRQTTYARSDLDSILPGAGRGSGQAGQGDRVPELMALCECIRTRITYQSRAEAGVQTPVQTLARGAGSCRDLAVLFIEAARHLGAATRFVSGYLRTEASSADFGATHAWAETYLPGRGWCGFDPSGSKGVGLDHIAVGAGLDPEGLPPVAGSFTGAAESSLEVGVWVTRL